MHHLRNIVEMVYLIHSGFDAFESIHGCWDVAGNRHAKSVGLGREGHDNVWLEQGVDLDLLESRGMIACYYGARLFRSVRAHRAERGWAAGVYQTRQQQAWPQGMLFFNRISFGHQKIKLASAILTSSRYCSVSMASATSPVSRVMS